MDEFRKPYEYVEENGISGILLVFFFMLIAIEPMFGIMSIYFGFNYMEGYGPLKSIFILASVIYLAGSVSAGILLKLKAGFAVLYAKVSLVFRFLVLIPFVSMNAYLGIKDIPFEKGYPKYIEMHRSIIISLVINIAYVAAFSIGWYIYLNASKKVRDLFQMKDGKKKIVA